MAAKSCATFIFVEYFQEEDFVPDEDDQSVLLLTGLEEASHLNLTVSLLKAELAIQIHSPRVGRCCRLIVDQILEAGIVVLP